MDKKPEPSSDPASSDELLQRLRTRLEEEAGWRGRLRSLPDATRLLVSVLIIAVLGLAVGLLLRRTDFAAYPAPRMVASLLLLAGLAVVLVRLFFWPLHRREPSAFWVGAGVLLALGIPLLLSLVPEAHGLVHEHPESFKGRGADFYGRAATCLLFGAVTALPLFAVLLLADRRDRPRFVRLALGAGVAGLAGNLTLLLHCPLVGRGHLVAGHATVGFAFLLLVGAAAWWRARRP